MKFDVNKYKAILKSRKEYVSKRLHVPGFHGMPLGEVMRYFFLGFTKGYIIDRGAAVAFFVFLAVFPTLLFFFTVIPLLPISGLHLVIIETLNELLPADAFKSMSNTISEILTRERNGLLSISALLTFYFSSSAFRAFFRGFDMGVNHLGNIGFVKKQLYSIFMAVVIGAMIIFSMTLFIVGRDFLPWFFERIGFHRTFLIFIINIVRWLLIVFTLLFAISILYYFGNPKHRNGKFRLFSPGSILSVSMMILGAFGFNFYVVNFSNFNSFYGSIGGILIFMLWIYVNCLIVLIGFELNASIQIASTTDDEPGP